ncbi:nucleoside deaminase [Pseudolysinimonas sp.]
MRNSEDADIPHLLRAIAVSANARENGNHPFGAILVSADGDVLLEAENTVVTDRDVTGHAETNLVRAASRELPADVRAASTLYASCEPCAMCAGAIFWAGIGRLVFALSGKTLLELSGPGGAALDLPSRLVLAAGDRETAVTGPLLEDEAAVPHRGFWAP